MEWQAVFACRPKASHFSVECFKALKICPLGLTALQLSDSEEDLRMCAALGVGGF